MLNKVSFGLRFKIRRPDRKQMKQRLYTFLNTRFFAQNNKETLMHISNRVAQGHDEGARGHNNEGRTKDRSKFSPKFLRPK
jgi:hypothetical protein